MTNHPHYEDKLLRETTFDVYQMYAMRTPEEVLERLGKYGTTHILVENSICYQGGRKEDNCATPDLLDLANNHLESDRTTKKVPNRDPQTKKSVCKSQLNSSFFSRPDYLNVSVMQFANPTIQVLKNISKKFSKIILFEFTN